MSDIVAEACLVMAIVGWPCNKLNGNNKALHIARGDSNNKPHSARGEGGCSCAVITKLDVSLEGSSRAVIIKHYMMPERSSCALSTKHYIMLEG